MALSRLSAAKELRGLFTTGWDSAPRESYAGASAAVYYGTVQSVDESAGIDVVALDGGVEAVPLPVSAELASLLQAGDRVKVTKQGGSFVVSATDQLSAKVSDAVKELIGFSKALGDLGEQIDGKVETWFYAYAPTTANEPASGWSDSDKEAHAGDLFFDTSTGYAYRWTGTSWAQITDQRIQGAMEAASRAEDTADSKRRVFTTQPHGPYDKGDLWVTNTSGTGDLYVCKTAEGNTGKFYQSDWVKATRYTDDTEVTLLAKSFELLSQRVTVKYRLAGGGGSWISSGKTATWYILKPTAAKVSSSASVPVIFWCSVPLTMVNCPRPYGAGYASENEWLLEWPTAAGVSSDSKLPETFVGASCEGDTADAYSWNRTTDGVGPLILVANANKSLPATRLEVFCMSRV